MKKRILLIQTVSKGPKSTGGWTVEGYTFHKEVIPLWRKEFAAKVADPKSGVLNYKIVEVP